MKEKLKKKIELLAPAGCLESLVVAVDSGCDAVYLGIDSFNARSRAKNFKIEHLPKIMEYCHKRDVKVYITLNTLVKNSELGDLVKALYKIVQCHPDAIIFQDWGVFYLLKSLGYKHLHASTQAGFHNSRGVEFAKKIGVERTILARELTLPEIRYASNKGEVEVFVHGALCYSLSGSCLFSSYLGGMSANRGKCKQPCRRVFNLTKRKKEHLFSLKDFELIDYIPQLIEAEVSSIKIEGRMKRPEYVKKVVTAYRMAIDHPDKIAQAKEILSNDFGRTKTAYFAGGDVSHSISEQPFAGIYLGKGDCSISELTITANNPFEIGDKIKVYLGEEDSDTYTITKIQNSSNQHVEYINTPEKVRITFNGTLKKQQGINVYKVSSGDTPLTISPFKNSSINSIPNHLLKSLLKSPTKKNSAPFFYIRVKDINQIKDIPRTMIKQKYIIPIEIFSEEELRAVKNRNSYYWELPTFISELDLRVYKKHISILSKLGAKNFSISHISQIDLIPNNCTILANENIYSLNDLAIKQLKEFGINEYILPLENEIPNLNHYKRNDGILPIFFTPPLFTSRMPVTPRKIKDRLNEYEIVRKGKLTITYPLKPVSIFSFLKKVTDYNNYFIDISVFDLNKEYINKIFKQIKDGKNIEDSSKFNYKKGLW